MLAVVGLLTCVRPHVFLELGRVAEAFSALHAHVSKVFAVHGQQVPIEQALFGRLILAVFALVELGILVT